MLFALPSDDALYEALIRRDDGFEGRAYVGVSSTGIFCRLSCTARKPKRENCRFFEMIAECLEAGFRPCRRCRPLLPLLDTEPMVARLVEALESDPRRRWGEEDIAALGYDPSVVRRAFKRQYGMTFLEMARLTRVRVGFEALEAGARVIDAQLEAGFSSSSAFREAFAKLLGVAPGALPREAPLKADVIDSPLGAMLAVADGAALHLLEFIDRKALPGELARLRAGRDVVAIGRTAVHDRVAAELDAYFAGRAARFETPLAVRGTPFTRRVWEALRAIPAGETRSYADLARTLGEPRAVRAVARANGANEIAIIIPCHRVIGADGSLTGYGGGLWRKQWLIEVERLYRPARPDASP
jgi:AraC family transcriptional regulator of adaptative response/methylated-DNA-[protein]-cysteine methyltransferase